MLLRKKEGWGWFVGFVLGWGGGGDGGEAEDISGGHALPPISPLGFLPTYLYFFTLCSPAHLHFEETKLVAETSMEMEFRPMDRSINSISIPHLQFHSSKMKLPPLSN